MEEILHEEAMDLVMRGVTASSSFIVRKREGKEWRRSL